MTRPAIIFASPTNQNQMPWVQEAGGGGGGGKGGTGPPVFWSGGHRGHQEMVPALAGH